MYFPDSLTPKGQHPHDQIPTPQLPEAIISTELTRFSALQNLAQTLVCTHTVHTISDLRQLDISTLDPLTVVQVSGYYEPADHGGGLFVWFPQLAIAIDRNGDGQDESPDDFGGTILAPLMVTDASQVGRWVRVFDGATLHTLWFGIKSNRNQGTDASERINLAIKRACTLSYNGTSGSTSSAPSSYNPSITLEIDPGQYEIKKPLQLPPPILPIGGANGSGATDLVIMGSGERTQIFWSGSDSTQSVIRLSNYKNTELKNFQIINLTSSRCLIELVNDLGGPTPTGLRLTRLLLTSYPQSGPFQGKAVQFGIFFNPTGQESDRNNDLATLEDVRVTHTHMAYVMMGYNCHDIIFDHCSMAYNNIGLYADPGYFKWRDGFATDNRYTDFFIASVYKQSAILGHNSEHSGRLIQSGICQGNITVENTRFESTKAIAGCAVAIGSGSIFTLRNCQIGAGDSTRIHYYTNGGYPYWLSINSGKNAIVDQCFFTYRKAWSYTDDFLQDLSSFIQFDLAATAIDLTTGSATLIDGHGFSVGQAVTTMTAGHLGLPRIVYLSFNPANPNLCRFHRTYSDAIAQTNPLPLSPPPPNQPVRFSTLACPIYISKQDWSVTVGAITPANNPTSPSELQSVMLMTPRYTGVKSLQLAPYQGKTYANANAQIIHADNAIKLSQTYQARVARLKQVRGPVLITVLLDNDGSDSISFLYSSAKWMTTTDYYNLPVLFTSDQALLPSIQLCAKLTRTWNFYNTRFTEVDLVLRCTNLPSDFQRSFVISVTSMAGLQDIGMDVERVKPQPIANLTPVPFPNTLGLLSAIQMPLDGTGATPTQKIPVTLAGTVYYLLASQ